MIRVIVLTEWEVGPDGGNQTPLFTNLPPESSASDITGQAAAELVPTPNACVCEVLTDEAGLDVLEADPRWIVMAWEEVEDAA